MATFICFSMTLLLEQTVTAGKWMFHIGYVVLWIEVMVGLLIHLSYIGNIRIPHNVKLPIHNSSHSNLCIQKMIFSIRNKGLFQVYQAILGVGGSLSEISCVAEQYVGLTPNYFATGLPLPRMYYPTESWLN